MNEETAPATAASDTSTGKALVTIALLEMVRLPSSTILNSVESCRLAEVVGLALSV